jgi:hypothetical protein
MISYFPLGLVAISLTLEIRGCIYWMRVLNGKEE